MRNVLLALSGAAIALTTAAAASPVTGFTCTKWRDGVCVSTHRVRGTPAPYATGYVFGPSYTYTPISDIPPPVVSYYHLDANGEPVLDGLTSIEDEDTGGEGVEGALGKWSEHGLGHLLNPLDPERESGKAVGGPRLPRPPGRAGWRRGRGESTPSWPARRRC